MFGLAGAREGYCLAEELNAPRVAKDLGFRLPLEYTMIFYGTRLPTRRAVPIKRGMM